MTYGPSAWHVQAAIDLARRTIAELRDSHGQILENDDEILPALAGEGITDVNALLSRLGQAILDAESDVNAANARIEALTARRDRHAKRHQVMRDTLLHVLQAIGLKKYADAEFSASWRHGQPKLIITDVDALPAAMVDVKPVVHPDRDLIRAALEAGEDVRGATLGNSPPILTIRSH